MPRRRHVQPLQPLTYPISQAQNHQPNALFCQQKSAEIQSPIQSHHPSTEVENQKRSYFLPHPPNPIQASPLAITALAVNGSANVGAVVRWCG